MRDGQRKYNYEYNYQEVFDYFDTIDSDENNSNRFNDDTVSLAPGKHNSEETLDDIDPTLLAQVEKELQRIHHRKANLTPYEK